MHLTHPDPSEYHATFNINNDINIIDVGGNGYIAVAVWLLAHADNFYSPLGEPMLDELFSKHFEYFPQHRIITDGLASPMQWLKRVTRCPNILEWIVAFRATFENLVCDEIYTYYERYLALFIHAGAMREVAVRIVRPDAVILAALTKRLNLPMCIMRAALGQDVFAYDTYGRVAVQHTLPLVLHLHGADYFLPEVVLRPWLKPRSIVHASDVMPQSIEKIELQFNLLHDNVALKKEQLRQDIIQLSHQILKKLEQHAFNEQELHLFYLKIQEKITAEGPRFVGTEHSNLSIFSRLVYQHSGQACASKAVKTYWHYLAEYLAFTVACYLVNDHLPWSDIERTCVAISRNL